MIFQSEEAFQMLVLVVLGVAVGVGVYFLISYLYNKKGMLYKSVYKHHPERFTTVKATVIKISQRYESGGYVNDGSGSSYGSTEEYIYFETENGERLSFYIASQDNLYNVGDTGLLTYYKNNFGGFIVSNDRKEDQNT